MTAESPGGHRMLREQLGAYALGQLGGDRWRAVHAHLQVCAVCRADLDEIAPVAGLLAGTRGALPLDELATPAPEPPPLAPELLAQVRGARQPPAPAAPVDLGIRRAWRRLSVTAAAAAVVVAATLGYVVGADDGIPREPVALRVLDPTVQASADLVPHTWGMEVELTASGFARGETYLVTIVADDGRTSSAGEFIGIGEREMLCKLNSSILRAEAASVQVAAPDGTVVLDAAI